MTTYAGHFGPDNFVDSADGDPVPGASIEVRLPGTTDKADLYTDRTKSTAAANPIITDAYGNAGFWADPGFYDLYSAGVTIENVMVGVDPFEPLGIERLVVDVTAPQFGASGDGVTDDRAAIQLAVDFLTAIGGGVLYFPAGVYLVSVVAHPVVGANYYAGIFIPSNCIMRGAGRGNTHILLAPNTISFNPALSRSVSVTLPAGNINAGANTDITVEDIEINGNAGEQERTIANCSTTNGDATMTAAAGAFSSTDIGSYVSGAGIPTDTYIASINSATSVELSANATATSTTASLTVGAIHNGMHWVRCTHVSHHRVRFTNVRGTASAPPGETFHCAFTAGFGVIWDDCEVVGTIYDSGSGIAALASTKVALRTVTSYNMTHGLGVALWECRDVTVTDTIGFLNGGGGLNFEFCTDLRITSSLGGGRASDVTGNDPWPLANGQALGNTQHGIVINTCENFQLTSSSATDNGWSGVSVVNSTGVINGGNYSDNDDWGIHVDAASVVGTVVTGAPICEGNANNNFLIGPHDGDIPAATNGPAMPAVSGTVVTNPYPVECDVYIDGNFDYLRVMGAFVGGNAIKTYIVPASGAGNITPNWTGTPGTWIWVLRT